MNATANDAQAIQDFKQLKNRLKTTWMTGDYDLFSRFMRKDAERFFRRLGVTPGTRLLDVGCGAGQLALIAARQVHRLLVVTLPLTDSRGREPMRRPKDLRSRLKRVMPNHSLMPMLSLTQ